MMPNRSADILFQLIQSLTKAEKRNFKLYITRNTGNAELKIIDLFDAFEKLDAYDETALLKKLPTVKKAQLANMKSHLYRQLLASLRLIKTTESIDIELHEQLDYAKILYNKGLYHQSLKLLDKVKGQARELNQDSYIIQAISLEKKIETLHITRSIRDRAVQLATESVAVHEKRLNITRLSNLALELYSWYIQNGHARNDGDIKDIDNYFEKQFTVELANAKGFYEEMYKYQCFVWYHFIRQDFLNYYRYTKKWVDLFKENFAMITIETGHFIKGFHNLMNAHYDLRNFKHFRLALNEFEEFAQTDTAILQNNNRIQTFVYLNSARLNYALITGEFEQAALLIPEVEAKLNEYKVFLDLHRILVFNYKFATIYFGVADYSRCIDYLQHIIQNEVDLRNDLQCYARLLHLLAHFELGNFDIIDSLTRSVYRYMAKMDNLTVVEEIIFKFLKKTFYKNATSLKGEFADLLAKLKEHEKNPFETRAFAYLDIISWVESKVYQKPMKSVIREKYLDNKHR